MAIQVFDFSTQLSAFRTHALIHGGSSDVQSGAHPSSPSDVDINGRYARQYSEALPDVGGRTISFWCDLMGRDPDGAQSIAILTGCPWGTAAERDVTYAALASAGCNCNDVMRTPLGERAKLARTVVNLTPHALVIGDVAIEPAGLIARAVEAVTPAEPIAGIPTSVVKFAGTADLPAPVRGVWFVVSSITASAATDRRDLLVPGEQVRDAQGRIVGCRSLARVS